MRPTTLVELATVYGMPVPETRGFGSFSVFSGMYQAACDVLRTEADWRRLVRETVEDAAAAGAVWVEPAVYLPHHLQRLGPSDDLLALAVDEAERVGAALGVGVGFMIASDRTLDPADAIEQAHLASRWADRGVVSFGLANDEALFGPEPFEVSFRMARDAGLLLAPHAGELAGPESIRGALDVLRADRIQHGVRAVEDPALVERLAASEVCLDVCPTSNVMLSVVPVIGEHPLPALLEAGVRCSVNGDDPLLFGPGLLEEYDLCRNSLGLDDHAMARIACCSIESSGAPADLKARALDDVARWLAG